MKFTPFQRVILLVVFCVAAVGLMICLTSCATNPDGTLTEASKANLIQLEQFALTTAVNVGTQALVTGSVDQTTIVNSINNGAAVLNGVIATQTLTPANVAVKTQDAIAEGANTKIAKKELAPEIAQAVNNSVKAGVPPKQAAAAAARGMKKGAAKLKAK